jgi:hypothetical protein
MMNKSLPLLIKTLAREAGWSKALLSSANANNLQKERANLLRQVREVGKSGDLALMVATEKAIVNGELEHYANSGSMVSSLNTAIMELTGIEKLLAIVDDKQEYSRVDQSHSFPKNREKGLPLDEARQAFKSHYARLNNLDKARLSEDEKQIIDARKSNLYQAGKRYAERQAKTLGINVTQARKRGQSL